MRGNFIKSRNFFSQSPKKELTYLRHSPPLPLPPRRPCAPQKQIISSPWDNVKNKYGKIVPRNYTKQPQNKTFCMTSNAPVFSQFPAAFKTCFGPCHLNERTCLECRPYLHTHTHTARRHGLFAVPGGPWSCFLDLEEKRKASANETPSVLSAFKTKAAHGPVGAWLGLSMRGGMYFLTPCNAQCRHEGPLQKVHHLAPCPLAS
jgi:hypothetical protein